MGNLISLILGLLLLTACAKHLPANLEKGVPPGGTIPRGNGPGPDGPNNDPEGNSRQFIHGSFITSEGQTVVVDELLQKPLVLIFAQDTCLACREESEMLVRNLASSGGAPTNVDLYTVLVGNILEDAQDFKQSLGILWSVGFQTGDSFFKSYCPSLTVPCVVVQTPAQGLIFQKSGKFEIEELEKYTGSWSHR